MKLVKGWMLGLFALGLVVLLSSTSFAEKGHEQRKIKLLNDAAEALKQSNPQLADGLTKFANEEAAEKEEKDDKKKEAEETKENNEKQHAEHIQLLKDSAAALQSSHPELAEHLTKMANHMMKRMEEKKEDKEDSKEMEEKETNDKK